MRINVSGIVFPPTSTDIFPDQALKRLENELSRKREKNDWSIREAFPHDCSDCKRLQTFLSSATEQKIIWPLAKERRSHIHQIIDGMDIPVTHVTEHVGSPHKLHLTKTPEIFSRDEVRMRAAEKALAKLRKLTY